MTRRGYRGAGAPFDDTSLALKRITIDAWMGAAKVAAGTTLDAASRAAIARMVDLLRQDAESMTFARTHGRAGAPPSRRMSRRESLLAIVRRAAEEGDDPYGLVDTDTPEDGARTLADDLSRILDGDTAVAARLDPFLGRVHRVAATLSAKPGERLIRL